jgi:pimeloyl-ACP methyl ester carboxylesterase
MQSGYTICCGREIHYTDWGRADAPPVLMWHGLARTGRDFDDLAAGLAERYRVLCPDQIGRGLSEWSPDPDREYCLDFYAGIARAFADALGVGCLHWVGTSMGGALGIRAAATTLRGRILSLVVNDIGPTLPAGAAERIRTYVAAPPEFARVSGLEAYLRQVYAPFGALTDAQWRRMAESSVRRRQNGSVTTHYDPAIVRQLFVHPRDYEQWEHWESLHLPVLVLRGAESDLLLPDVAEAMTIRGPRARLAEFAGCGHAPALNVPPQIEMVRGFLHENSRGAAPNPHQGPRQRVQVNRVVVRGCGGVRRGSNRRPCALF